MIYIKTLEKQQENILVFRVILLLAVLKWRSFKGNKKT